MADSDSLEARSVAPFYADWPRYNDRIVAALRGLSAADLALRPAPDQWPIWAIAAHAAGARVLAVRRSRRARGRDDTLHESDGLRLGG